MLLIKQKVDCIDNVFTDKEGLYKFMEKIGRVCYKSENKITETSYETFVRNLINKVHTSVLEHGTVYMIFKNTSVWNKYINNPYSKYYIDKSGVAYVTTNFRVLVENCWLSDMIYMCKPTQYHHIRKTFKIQCSRAIANEIVRHRAFSYTQESTRFTKYVGELEFIKPFWCSSPEGVYTFESMLELPDSIINLKDRLFLYSVLIAEENFKILLSKKARPQEVRDILPLSFKTDLYMTGFVEDFIGVPDKNKGFIPLRIHNSAHPDISEIAKAIKNYILEDTYYQNKNL